MRLFLTAVSFEDRCLALANDLRSARPQDTVVVIDFTGYENVSQYMANRFAMLKIIEGKGYEIDCIEVETGHPLAAVERLSARILALRPSEILVDISSLPKSHLFLTMRLLASRRIPTKVRYYRPEIYGSELSHGIRAIQAIPGFEGNVGPTGEVILGIILGFEGYKALNAWERIGPSRVIAFLGDPPYVPEFLERSKSNNRDLLEGINEVRQVSLHTHDAVVAKEQLSGVYFTSGGETEDSFVLCPLGTKIQSLAAFAFAFENDAVAVAYVSSVRYFTEDYSRGWKKTYYEVDLGSLISSADKGAPREV
jgi:hypothetical protein